RGRGTPDVQIEAIFRADLLVERLPDRAVVLSLRRRAEEAADLAAGIGIVLGRSDSGPRIRRFRRLPPKRAHRRLGEGNAAPRDGVSVRLHHALDLAEFGGANRAGGRSGVDAVASSATRQAKVQDCRCYQRDGRSLHVPAVQVSLRSVVPAPGYT